MTRLGSINMGFATRFADSIITRNPVPCQRSGRGGGRSLCALRTMLFRHRDLRPLSGLHIRQSRILLVISFLRVPHCEAAATPNCPNCAGRSIAPGACLASRSLMEHSTVGPGRRSFFRSCLGLTRVGVLICHGQTLAWQEQHCWAHALAIRRPQISIVRCELRSAPRSTDCAPWKRPFRAVVP